MNRFRASKCFVSAALMFAVLPSGCDSKEQKQRAADEAVVEEFKAYQQENQDRHAQQSESGEYNAPDSTEAIDRYVDLVDKTADQASPELAAQLRSQAEIMKEFKALLDPYLTIDNKFVEIGGIDPATIGNIEDLDQRVEMIRLLKDMNDNIDAKFPELFLQITGADTPEGRRQLEMTKAIRQTNREAYPHMMQALQIVRKHWETSGNADDGNFYFGNDVPAEDIDQYNFHLQSIDALAVKQMEIQQRYQQSP